LKVLVCGSRHWDDDRKILDRLSKLPKGTFIIQGGANGADSMAKRAAKLLGFTVWTVSAEWNKFGKAAGPTRNRRMLDLEPDLVIAFHNDLTTSKGTIDTINEAKRRGIKVEVVV